MIADRPLRSRWRRAALGWGAALLLVIAGEQPARAATPTASTQQIQVEAAFLINFVRFTQWPPERFLAADAPYVIAVVGSDDDSDIVRNVAAAAGNVQGRRVAVVNIDPGDVEHRQKRALDILRGSHLVFVRSNDADVRRQLLAALAGLPVLTVGDAPGFAAYGGMLGLVRSGARIAFEANPDQIQAAGVQVSAKVLKLARIRRGRT